MASFEGSLLTENSKLFALSVLQFLKCNSTDTTVTITFVESVPAASGSGQVLSNGDGVIVHWNMTKVFPRIRNVLGKANLDTTFADLSAGLQASTASNELKNILVSKSAIVFGSAVVSSMVVADGYSITTQISTPTASPVVSVTEKPVGKKVKTKTKMKKSVAKSNKKVKKTK